VSDTNESKIGAIGWRDLTVENAEEVRDFYQAVVGWETKTVSMGDYEDYYMTSPQTGDPIAGVCHARGGNADLPPQWLLYVIIADLDQSISKCKELGGEVIAGPKSMGDARYCVIRDPAGAVCGLYQSAP
jgi:predicted enzyme related to lactoylglutathione lyase